MLKEAMEKKLEAPTTECNFSEKLLSQGCSMFTLLSLLVSDSGIVVL